MYRLPAPLRAELARPLAKVLTTEEALALARGRFLVAVGDVCSERFIEAGRVPDVIVADWKTQRGTDLARFRALAAKEPATRVLKVKNPAGVVTEALWEALAAALAGRGRALVEVDGEEDLAVLPAVLLAPEGAAVAYGQPPAAVYGASARPADAPADPAAAGGVVIVIVTPEFRRHVRGILDRMEVV